MAINTITFANKSDINTSSVPAANKWTASDINEVKSVVNSNANLMGDLSNLATTDNSSIVGAINEVVNGTTISTNGAKTSIKFENGLMINTIQFSYAGVSVTTGWGGIYASATQITDDYLTPFTELFSVNVSAKPSSGNHWFMVVEDSINQLTTAPRVQFLRGASGQATGTLNITAIGKWK